MNSISGPPSKFGNKMDWLAWLEQAHPKSIELGLDRIRTVYDRLKVKPTCPVITVAGTNGKGSCMAMLESLCRHASLRCGVYTSPHLLEFNERIRIDSDDIGDDDLVTAFQMVYQAQQDVSLTYFEFTTLAAFVCFANADLDVWLLEVGLGGRLDAVNLIDADCAVLTTIAQDHSEFLGTELNGIAAEKAGIFRAGKPAVVADTKVLEMIRPLAQQHKAELYEAGKDFSWQDTDFSENKGSLVLQNDGHKQIPLPAIRLDNAAAASFAFSLVFPQKVTHSVLTKSMQDIRLNGRAQMLTPYPVMVDVAHNAQATGYLAKQIERKSVSGRVIALCGMLKDKDLEQALGPLKRSFDEWHLVPLNTPRSAATAQLRRVLEGEEAPVVEHPSIAAAAQQLVPKLNEQDLLVVFGSFYTVADMLRYYRKNLSVD